MEDTTPAPVIDVRDHFTPDELVDLAVAAAEAIHGNPDNLSEAQITLAGRAFTLLLDD